MYRIQSMVVCYLCSVLLIMGSLFLPAKEALCQKATAEQLTVAYLSEPDALNPTDSSYGVTSYPISNNIIERLVDLSTDGKLVPGIASWEIQADGKEFLFTLRKDVKFHSGDALTAADFAFSHARAMEKGATYKRYMRDFDKLEVIDDYHVKYIFKTPQVLFIPTRNVQIVSKSYFDKVGEETFVNHPVGTGPYKFVAWKRGEYIDLERNENYWGPKPQVKRVRFVFVKEDTTRVSMLKAGEADLIMSAPYPLVKDIEAAGFKTVRLYTHPPCSVQFHTANPKVPWHDRRVRLAIAHAIDKEAIVKDLFQGIPAGYPRLAPWEVGYDKDLKQYPYDPKKAKELLAEAGYAKGFEMPLYFFAGRTYGHKETAEVVALYLKAVGITCKVEGIEGAQMLAKIRGWHDDPNTVYAGVAAVPMAFLPDPVEALTTAYHSSGFGAMHFSKDLDTVIDQSSQAMDDGRRAELIKKAVRIIHDDVATIQIWSNTSVYAMKPEINFTPTLKNREPLIQIKDIVVK